MQCASLFCSDAQTYKPAPLQCTRAGCLSVSGKRCGASERRSAASSHCVVCPFTVSCTLTNAVQQHRRRSTVSSRRSRTRKQAHFTNALSNRELLAGNNAFVAIKVNPRRYFNRHFAIVIQLVHLNHLQRRIGL